VSASALAEPNTKGRRTKKEKNQVLVRQRPLDGFGAGIYRQKE
jgi:hypothetical protein